MGVGLVERGQEAQKLLGHMPVQEADTKGGDILEIQKNQQQPSIHGQWDR